MFKRRGTIIAEGLKIRGSVSAQGLVEVNGQIEGDVHCTSLFVSRKRPSMAAWKPTALW